MLNFDLPERVLDGSVHLFYLRHRGIFGAEGNGLQEKTMGLGSAREGGELRGERGQ